MGDEMKSKRLLTNNRRSKIILYLSTVLLGLSAGLLLFFVIVHDILGYDIKFESLFSNLSKKSGNIEVDESQQLNEGSTDSGDGVELPNEITSELIESDEGEAQENNEIISENRFLRSSSSYGRWAEGTLPVAEVVIPEISYDQASSPANNAPIPIRQECTGSFLRQIEVNGELFCALDVPYVNQSLNSNGAFTQNPSGIGDVNYMCTTASSVMIAGYYNKLQYQSLDELREHMYMSKSNPPLVKDNVISFRGRDIKLCTDGAFALTSFNYSTGISHCNWSHNIDVYPKYLGLSVVNISLNYDNIANNLTNGNPILMSISPRDDLAGGIWEYHSVVVTGFSIQGTEHKILLNDPFRDLSAKYNNTCGGLTLGPEMSGYNSVYSFDNPICARANYAWVMY